MLSDTCLLASNSLGGNLEPTWDFKIGFLEAIQPGKKKEINILKCEKKNLFRKWDNVCIGCPSVPCGSGVGAGKGARGG